MGFSKDKLLAVYLDDDDLWLARVWVNNNGALAIYDLEKTG